MLYRLHDNKLQASQTKWEFMGNEKNSFGLLIAYNSTQVNPGKFGAIKIGASLSFLTDVQSFSTTVGLNPFSNNL